MLHYYYYTSVREWHQGRRMVHHLFHHKSVSESGTNKVRWVICTGLSQCFEFSSVALTMSGGCQEEHPIIPEGSLPEVTPQTSDRRQKASAPAYHSSWQWMDSSDLDPHLIHASLRRRDSAPPTACRSIQPILHTPQQTLNVFLRGEQPPKIAPSPWGMWSPSNSWFSGPTWLRPDMASWPVQLFLQGSQKWPTDRLTMQLNV